MIALALAPLPRFSLTERWRVAFPARNGMDSAGEMATMGGRLFVREPGLGGRGDVDGIDLASGRLLWARRGPDETAQRLVVGGGHVVVRASGELRELDPADGRIVWRTKGEPNRLGPFIADGRLVAEVEAGRLSAFDLRTHALAWSLRYPAPFANADHRAAGAVAGGSLWAVATDGRVVRVRLADGRLEFARPFGGGKPLALVPLIGCVAVWGEEGIEGWRASDGKRLWRARGLPGGWGFAGREGRELWAFPDEDDNLYRLRASDGSRVGTPMPVGHKNWVTADPAPFGGGWVLPTWEGLVRLDAEGRATGLRRIANGMFASAATGGDVVALAFGRVVRYAPGERPSTREDAARAEAIVAAPALADDAFLELERLGRAAVEALVAAIPKATGARLETLRWALVSVAEARDTPRVFPLMDAAGSFGKDAGYESAEYRRWLETRADPDWLARRLLPRLRATRDPEAQARLVGFMAGSTDPVVIDDLFRRLRAPGAPEAVRGEIYGWIAASGRRDVLAWIRRERAQGRRLARPLPGRSTTEDADGDGIPDAYDANPWVAPRALSERERVMAAAFDAFARADGWARGMSVVEYGRGVRPFELVGWRDGLRPFVSDARPDTEERSQGFRFEALNADGDVVRFDADGRGATVRVARRRAYGTEARLRKMGGEWYVVSLRETWVH